MRKIYRKTIIVYITRKRERALLKIVTGTLNSIVYQDVQLQSDKQPSKFTK